MDPTAHRKVDLLGAVVANAYNLLIIAMFLARLADAPRVAYWLGLIALFSVVPLSYMLVTARAARRPPIYFIWLGLMILFQLAEVTLDYILVVEFRDVRWAVILYVVFFFAATGGMIGLASLAGKRWAVVTVVTFLAMAALAFVQRAVTGL